MSYKAFQDWYHEGQIKHLLIYEYQGNIISPPFATEQCKEYSKVLIWNKDSARYIDLTLPPVTSKTNAVIIVGESAWLIPYGIFDNFSTVVELQGDTPIYHNLGRLGKGQFYSGDSNGKEGFSFPLGYEDTNYGIYIKEGKVSTIEFNVPNYTKLHMGTVYANGRFWSMPRSDTPGYDLLISFDGQSLSQYRVPVNPDITRKFTDLIAVGNTLYSLPFGETPGLNEIIEFNTDTEVFNLYPIPGPDFAKKYNNMVLVGTKIIGLPYGDEHEFDSNLGILFDIVTKEITQFDIGISYGGKYRYRSGIAYQDCAYFFPSGTPSCPILKIDQAGNILKSLLLENTMVGRAIVYHDKLFAMSYNIVTNSHALLSFDNDLNYTEEYKL